MDMQQNPFADLVPNRAPQPQQPYRLGAPDPILMAREHRAESSDARVAAAAERSAAAAERAAANVPSGYRQTAGGLEPIPGGPADPARPQPTSGSARSRQLPNTQIQRLTDGTTSLSNLQRARDSFQDNYGGNLFGGLENSLQSLNGNIGTPGQAQFWSDVGATDNVARNALFGASLTQGEKDAWAATTIRPSMDAGQIRANLNRRIEIARGALGRLARTNAANGFNREAISASLGDYSDLLDEGTMRQQGPAALQDAAQGAMIGGAEGQNDPNFAERVLNLPAGSEERFRMLESHYNAGAGDQRHAQLSIGVVPGSHGQIQNDPNGPMEYINQYGLTDEQDQALRQEYLQQIPIHETQRNREQFLNDHPVLGNADVAVRSAANAMTLGYADRAAASLNGTSAEQEHAITQTDWENRPIAALGGTLAGGTVLPVGSTLPRQIGLGGLYGGTYNFNASDGDINNRIYNGAIGTFEGGALAGLVGVGLRAAGRGGPPTNPQNADLMAAAQRQRVDLMPADVGGSATRRMTGGAGQTVFGSGPIISGAQRTERQVGARLSEIAGAEGAPVRQEVLGDRTRSTMEGFNARSGEHGRNLYANARDLAEGTQLQGTRANEVLNNNLQELQATRNTDAPLISGLERLQSDIAPNGQLANLNIDQIRRLRTTVRSEAQTEGLRATDYQRRANGVLDALSNDIAEQLPPAAAREFREADQAWARRLDFIDDVENNLLGPKNDRSAEAVSRRLMDMSRGDSARFARVLDTVPAEEAGMIRGSAIQELGRASNGSPNAGGFSLDSFLTKFEALPERSRNLLFRGQSRADIDDLVMIARARREAAQYINRSGTGGSVNTTQLIQRSSQAMQNASTLAAWSSLGGTALLENVTGRLLSSPRFVRFLARPPRDPSRAVRVLRRIAVAEPSLSGNIGTLIEAVQRSGQNLETAVPRAAADDGQDRR